LFRAGPAASSRWLATLQEVDGQPFSANVYDVTGAIGGPPAAGAPIFVERFEVPPELVERFDEWLVGTHAPALAAQRGVARARTFAAVRDAIPIALYRSPGNRMLRVDLEPADVRTTLLSDGFVAALADSMRWDRELAYVTRDACTHLFQLDADA
jgi:hypothetical protein